MICHFSSTLTLSNKMDVILTKKDGKIENAQVLKQMLLNLTDWSYMLTIKKWSKRSLEQNMYYRAILTAIQNDTGVDKDELHEWFKNMFLKSTFVSEVFWETTTIWSTTKLTVWWFVDYCEKVAQRCREQWYEIPTK